MTHKRIEGWLLVVTVIVIGSFYWWTALPAVRGPRISDDSREYYNLLARGFIKGQLSLDAEVDPSLATMKNPWDPVERAGRGLHDATYYRGKYYIYFGVGPELLLFVPFRVLTGRYISESCASVIFGWMALAASSALLFAIRWRYFAKVSRTWMLGGVLALGLAGMFPTMLRRASVWEVPIACAYACEMLSLGFLYRSVLDTRRNGWLVAASIASGLAVAARPTYLFGTFSLLIPCLYAVNRYGGWRRCWRVSAWRKRLGSSVVPLALIGLGLAWYNYARFGRLAEFGQTYQMAGDDVTKLKLFSWRYPLYGFKIYLLSVAGHSPYFPFFTVISPPKAPPGSLGLENPYGIIPNIPFVLAALGLFLLFRRRKDDTESNTLAVFCVTAAVAAGLTMLTVMSFGGITSRYMVDFVPSYILLACVGTFVIRADPWCQGLRSWGLRGALGGALVFSLLFGVLVSIQHNDLLRVEQPGVYRKLAHRSNYVSYFYDKLAGTEYGPIIMKVVFPKGRDGQVECLLATGLSFRADYLFVHYASDDRVRFGLEHTSLGTTAGEFVHINPGETHELRIDMGSLYPPSDHPYYDHLPKGLPRLLQRTLRVTLNGQVVLQGITEFYDATAHEPSIGTAGSRPGFTEHFSGRILSWQRAPDQLLAVPTIIYGPVRLQLKLPPFIAVKSEPLVCSGESGRGDLVFVRYLNDHQVQFGHDDWGGGGRMSEPVDVDYASPLQVDIDYGSLYPVPPHTAPDAPQKTGPLMVSVNGKKVMSMSAPYHLSEPETVVVGSNAIGASSSYPVFTGKIESFRRLAP